MPKTKRLSGVFDSESKHHAYEALTPDVVLDALRAPGAHQLRLAGDAGLAPIARVHRADYLNFLHFGEATLTELRSDNTIMGNAGSKSVPNRDLSDLDLFIPNTSHQAVYNYWIANYFNIRNLNVILNSLNVNYSATTGALVSDSTTVKITAAEKRAVVAEAAFIRAYHYFNLVRLFGGVFLIHEPVGPFDAINLNRSSEADIYKLIVADLQYLD